jgi:tRNA pseudouridine55 synthase
MDLVPPESGFLIIDKPEGMTSHDVVQVVRRRLDIRKAGHLGTLDPLATGVLPIAVGKATRLIEYLRDGLKSYEGTIRLGFSTDTYDKDGHPSSEPITPRTTQEQLNLLAAQMSGQQSQAPPPFSAKKIQGVRAYQLARKGLALEIAPQQIRVDQLTFTLLSSSEVDFKIRCSAGTYVRSVAHDLGVKLGCGAHLCRLRRLASGEFSERQSVTLTEFIQLSAAALSERMIPLNGVLSHHPSVLADVAVEKAFSVGRDFTVRFLEEEFRGAECYRVLSPNGQLLGLAERMAAATISGVTESKEFRFRPVVVLVAPGSKKSME